RIRCRYRLSRVLTCDTHAPRAAPSQERKFLALKLKLRLEPEKGLEAAKDHALAVEGQPILELLEARIFDGVFGDVSTRFGRVVNYPGKDHIMRVVADRIHIIKRAIFARDRLAEARHRLVILQLVLGHGDHKTFD